MFSLGLVKSTYTSVWELLVSVDYVCALLTSYVGVDVEFDDVFWVWLVYC